MSKKRKWRDVSDEDMGRVPLYRSYGVRKKARPVVSAINNTLAKLLMLGVAAFNFIIIAIVSAAFFAYGGALLATIVTLTLFWIFIGKHSRIPRRRWEFLRKLKRLCKRNKYRAEFVRRGLESYIWEEKGEPDIRLHANGRTYFIKYATAYKPAAAFTFKSREEASYTKYCGKNRFALVLGLHDKTKDLRIVFPQEEGERIILVNPMPRDIFVKTPDGSTVPTGSGERIYGYTVYSGTGFIEMLEREAKQYKGRGQ